MTASNSNSESWIDELFGTSSIVSDTTSTLSALESIGEALIDPRTYVRIFMVLFGLFLILGALRYA